MGKDSSLGKRAKIKKAHEDSVLANFVSWLNSRTAMRYEIFARPDPPDAPPDAVLKCDNKYLWVEHADIYRSGDEAHEEYSFITPGETPHLHSEHPIYDVDKRIAIAIINTINKKLGKNSYAESFSKFGKGILVLTERDPLFSESTLRVIKKELRNYKVINDLGYFRKIYLGIRTFNRLIFIKLYPIRLR